jgi:hypothetical protein
MMLSKDSSERAGERRIRVRTRARGGAARAGGKAVWETVIERGSEIVKVESGKSRQRDKFGAMNVFPKLFFSAAAVFAVLVSATDATTSSSGHPTGRLIVQRAPNFGTDLSIRLLIDGKKVADIPRNQHYGGVLAAGRHVLTALALPNTQSRRPTTIGVTIKSRQVYIFTATWEGDRLILRPSNFYMPTTRVKTR